MTTRTKRNAKSKRIETLIGSERGLLKDLVKDAQSGPPARTRRER